MARYVLPRPTPCGDWTSELNASSFSNTRHWSEALFNVASGDRIEVARPSHGFDRGLHSSAGQAGPRPGTGQTPARRVRGPPAHPVQAGPAARAAPARNDQDADHRSDPLGAGVGQQQAQIQEYNTVRRTRSRTAGRKPGARAQMNDRIMIRNISRAGRWDDSQQPENRNPCWRPYRSRRQRQRRSPATQPYLETKSARHLRTAQDERGADDVGEHKQSNQQRRAVRRRVNAIATDDRRTIIDERSELVERTGEIDFAEPPRRPLTRQPEPEKSAAAC